MMAPMTSLPTLTRALLRSIPAEPVHYAFVDTPVGNVLLLGAGGALVGLFLDQDDRSTHLEQDWLADDGQLADARTQLAEYFDGRRTQFDLEVRPLGTPFQQEVWAALLEVPYGHTASYADIARSVGRPGSCRAVGAANGRNPVSIVVPCHRVIGADGSLTGYGWGVDRKAWLLDHERAHL